MSPDRLTAAMVAHLDRAEARFDFLIQVRDPSMPVEDATAEWSEKRSSFRKVATITIPRQRFDTPDQQAFGESLSYTPWHALPEHRPIGGVNRARGAVYLELSER